MKVLVTGATGFIGKELVPLLIEKDYQVRVAVRRPHQTDLPVEQVVVGDFSADTFWDKAVAECDVVIHLAGLAHVLNKADANNPKPFFDVNHAATLALAKAASKARVKQFIFISSIGVHGTQSDTPIREDSPFVPTTPYAASKAAAEEDLQKLCALDMDDGMALTIIRPPLVYGKGAGGNFARLVKLVKLGVPLPFGKATQPRSIISRSNLTDAIACCIGNSAAYHEAFVVADAEQTSTYQLVKQLAAVWNKPGMTMPLPAQFLYASLVKIGRQNMADGLFSKLVVDMTNARSKLNWEPPHRQEDELKKLI